jgi:hypothetical protein
VWIALIIRINHRIISLRCQPNGYARQGRPVRRAARLPSILPLDLTLLKTPTWPGAGELETYARLRNHFHKPRPVALAVASKATRELARRWKYGQLQLS